MKHFIIESFNKEQICPVSQFLSYFLVKTNIIFNTNHLNIHLFIFS